VDEETHMTEMVFSPERMKVDVNWPIMKQAIYWRRQAVALYFHELVHMYDWVFTFHKNALLWNVNAEWLERRADKVQDMVLSLMRLGHLVEVR